MRHPAVGFAAVLDSLMEGLDDNAQRFAADLGVTLDPTVPPFVALSLGDRMALVQQLVTGVCASRTGAGAQHQPGMTRSRPIRAKREPIMPSRVELDPTAYAAYSSAMWGDLPRTEAAVRSMRPESRRAAQLACALLFHMVERIEDEEPPR